MPIKLPLKIGRSFLDLRKRARRGLELLAAESTDRNNGNLADMLYDPNGTFRHDQSLAHLGRMD